MHRACVTLLSVQPRSSLSEQVPRRLLNLRDVSSLAPQIAPGVLLRSEAPHELDAAPSGIAWPPATVVDLRRLAEQLVKHPFAGGSTVLNLPLLDPALGSSRSSAEIVEEGGLAALYLSLLQQAQPRLAIFVQTVATAPAPILVHCAVGKDRTGIAVALVLRLLDIDRKTVVADYLHTQRALADLIPRLIRTHIQNAHLDAEQAQRYHARFSALPPELLQANENAINAALDHWDQWNKGTLGWYLDHDGTDLVLQQLRRRLLLS